MLLVTPGPVIGTGIAISKAMLFVDGQRLGLPPGIESDLGEDRYRWTVRDALPEDAYDHLVRREVRDESVE